MDATFPDIAEWVVEWKVARKAATPMPSWQLHDSSKVEQACYIREPNLREVLNQTRQTRMAADIPVQQVTPLMLSPQEVPVFTLVRDLDQQCQQQFN